MYNIPWPSFLPCLSSTTFPPSKAHHNPCTTFLGHFSALPILTYPTNILPFVHRKPIMTRVPPSLAQLTPLHVTFYQCTFLFTVLSCSLYCVIYILACSKFKQCSYPLMLISSFKLLSTSCFLVVMVFTCQSFTVSKSVNNNSSLSTGNSVSYYFAT